MVSWGCKKQLKTALHTGASEIKALFKGTHKTHLLHDFLTSIGVNLSSPTPILEDNQGTIKLVKTSGLTDTVCHYAVKIAYIKEQMNKDAVSPASTKTDMMRVYCCTKLANGVQLYTQISYMTGLLTCNNTMIWTLLPMLGYVI